MSPKWNTSYKFDLSLTNIICRRLFTLFNAPKRALFEAQYATHGKFVFVCLQSNLQELRMQSDEVGVLGQDKHLVGVIIL